MRLLVPERVSFRISTTDLVLRYAERARTTVVVEGVTIDRPVPVTIEIAFDLAAEVRCVSMNFFEAEHGEHTVEKEADQVDPGFYSVRESVAPA